MTSKTNHEAHNTNGHAEEKQDATPDVGEGSSDAPSQIAALKAELAAMEDRWMRSEAEIANVRTRAKRDVEEARQFAVQKFAGDVVEAAENLRRGLGSLPPAAEGEPKSIAGLRAGLAEIERGFIDTLAKNGVTAIDPTGTVFASDQHQAVGQREAPGQVAGTVLQSLGPVWLLNGRLLRPAMVIVAKASDAQSAWQS
ncbi:nucleotide exchange factor GrpE [Cypionkella sinensis]|uniref:Protein GrpE n=1 Tax=Cypionkella sinensis TaxID=1756043 RepID=A0ABV7IZH4_9RHOB